MEKMVQNILSWYQIYKRDLPWRTTKNPYYIWISEIMLQQTRIEAVIPYYYRFIESLPTIYSLAQVDVNQLMKLWEGLGYYSRARNLKKSAEIIVSKYHGKFPTSYEEMIELPGIGDYTASAISSICFHEKRQVIDGNVLRVYARYFNDYSNVDDLKTKRRIKEHLETNMPIEAGEFNEGIMELGEIICLPNGIPHCTQCPLKQECASRKNNTFLELPIKNQKKSKKSYYYTILIFKYHNQFSIRQRTLPGLLHQLWEFPNVSGNLSEEQVLKYCDSLSLKVHKIEKGISYTHVFTHQKWIMHSFVITLNEIATINHYQFISKSQIESQYAIPTAFQPFLKALKEKD